MENTKKRINDSEIINQKKQFIFDVDQTSTHVFPNEIYTYYLYIKNISGVEINHFNIKIENPDAVNFVNTDIIEGHLDLILEEGDIQLYELNAYCSLVGDHIVHFIGYGEGTEIIHKQLNIKCTRTYNSDKLLHRLFIYDFTPYEEKYSIEAEDFNQQTTQIIKRQKLPYKAKKQPFPLQKAIIPENKESQSFIDQYNEAKNTKEHVYQYISRENFTEDSVENYTGENLRELFTKINEKSNYFKAHFLRSGTNSLINDFNQFAPNGFIHRMGLLSSEIYHYLGVLPTYSYMSDRLFRWAPEKNQPLNLIPEKKAMNWDEEIWAGRGWIVYRMLTTEYMQTEEYRKLSEKGLIEETEIIGTYEEKETAEETIKNLEIWDEIDRADEQSSIQKFEYKIRESIYDTGVFFVNIPIDKIPSNFYLMSLKEKGDKDDIIIYDNSFYNVINRAKPYGTKPILNYVIERTFNHHMDKIVIPNYHKNFLFDMESSNMFDIDSITSSTFEKETINCNGVTDIIAKLNPTRKYQMRNFYDEQQAQVEYNYSKKGIKESIEMDLEDDIGIHETSPDNDLSILDNVIDLLYQNNYNTLSFKIKPEAYISFPSIEKPDENQDQEQYNTFTEDEEGNIVFKIKNAKGESNTIIESLKLKISNRGEFNHEDVELIMTVEDILNKKHRIKVKYDKDLKMDFITYSYVNTDNKEFIRERGYQNIEGVSIIIKKINNKKILLFMIEDENKVLHYFHHVIVQDLSKFSAKKIIDKEEKDIFKTNIFYLNSISYEEVIFETPFIKKSKVFQPEEIIGGGNWDNFYRFNNETNSYSYIKNLTNDYIPVDDIYIHYDDINIPETSIIEKLRVKSFGVSTSSNKMYINQALNTSYLLSGLTGNKIQFSPNQIQCYNHLNESTIYYEIKVLLSEEEDQDDYVEEFIELLEQNYLFNEDIDVSVSDYLENPNDFITINNECWYELSDFTNLSYNLNDISQINFVIEGYNTGKEIDLLAETLYETDSSSTKSEKIPTGYFRKKINLFYPNRFLLDFLRLRFRFDSLNHNIKIFDTKMEIKFKNKQEDNIKYNPIQELQLYENGKNTTLLENYYNPADLNNGISLELNFDDLKPGDYYHLNSIELEAIYTETDIDMMINKNQYQDNFQGVNKSGISGKVESNSYLSGLFYNDVETISQPDENIGIDNNGIKLQDALYQLFETRHDNITSIELFPNGFKGNPDETLKIGLYENSYNTPGKLLKEIVVSGWVKNNTKLKNLDRIKYNFNINNLEINEKYWFKIEVLNPRENSYYLLKGIDKTKPEFKLLADEKNNYINTFSNLKFNIYSKNLSQSFNKIPILQESFDNPYILVGLHKGRGSIEDLQTMKYIREIK